jgi:hypothetical protein
MMGTAQSVGQSVTTTVPDRAALNPWRSQVSTAALAACSVKNVIRMTAPTPQTVQAKKIFPLNIQAHAGTIPQCAHCGVPLTGLATLGGG